MTEQISGLQGMGRGNREGLEGGNTKKHEQILGVMEMFIILMVVVVSQVCTCVITNQIAHVQYVCFITGQLYLKNI